MAPGVLLALLLLQGGLPRHCLSAKCYFCVDPTKAPSERCSFFADCPRDSPGCVTVEVEESHEERYTVRSCAFPERCNRTVVSYGNTNAVQVASCLFCERDLCNCGGRGSLAGCVAVHTALLLLLRLLL